MAAKMKIATLSLDQRGPISLSRVFNKNHHSKKTNFLHFVTEQAESNLFANKVTN